MDSAAIKNEVQLTMDQIDALGTAYRAKLSELKTCVILGPQEIGQQEYIEFTQMYKEETHAELDRLLSKFRPVEMLDHAKVASLGLEEVDEAYIANGRRPLLSSCESRFRSRSPAGKGKDNGKSKVHEQGQCPCCKGRGMNKGKDNGKGMGTSMDKARTRARTTAMSILQELHDKIEQIFSRAQDKTLPALKREVLDEVGPLLIRHIWLMKYALNTFPRYPENS